MSLLTIKLRIRDKHAAELNRQAEAVNTVWNYLNEVQKKAVLARRRWLSKFDLMSLTSGSSKLLNIHAHTIQRVCHQYDDSRRARRRPWLRWRTDRSLGWVPFNTGHVTFDGRFLKFRGAQFEPMHYRDVLHAGADIGAGSFSRDARGRWYANLPVRVEVLRHNDKPSVGVDLGLKVLATLSTGSAIDIPQFYRKAERRLALAQRARKTRRVQAVARKIANRRKDFLHKASRALVDQFGLIVVGDVSPSTLAKTSMAKSVHDAGWANFKNMLSYKALMHGGRMLEVSEAYTTQVCSACGSMPASRPRGIADLGIRDWRCDDCGAVHDRDVNAACNILRLGQQSLVEGALA